ncbi:SUMO-specific isopeptidase USPL1 [Pristis pectinata]|uniref:SUMO-specific isopeptidase USPL1 n=1 Tax=Pristis pectinata TaxID=685728 RepID=UPI00223DABF0|nr:SUMO-specific isopeptidase USPL1 [Pristis pectinata]XP_051882217.1 SUMO-specific isopeptidase USPL1 [Pristis pectinata]
MVKVSLLPSMTDKQKTKTCLPLSGPGTDINVSSIHTVGYLGKFSQSTLLDLQEYCPVCAADGKRQALRRYCISFEESILLCENPQCFFPLGCKPLNEILISSTLASPQSSDSSAKSVFESGLLVQPCKQNIKRQKTLNCSDEGTGDSLSGLSKEGAFQFADSSLNRIDNFVPCSKNGNNHEAVNPTTARGTVVTNEPIPVAPVQLCGKRKEPSAESEHSGLEVPKEELYIEQLILQWKNTSALCWLDCILTALVHLKMIRNVINNVGTEVESPIKKLCTEYDQACALLCNSQCHGTGDGSWHIPPQLLIQIELILNDVRESCFKLLQPKLRCELGKPDSPVFAFPLLLRHDTYFEKFFMQSYIWSFECIRCGYKYDERCTKTLPTFTKVDSDWHPLNAVHKSPCNKCQDKDQRRKMLIERISSIYMLHFVDGLPHTDLNAYRFDFQGSLYRICTVIQYLQRMKHFVTWIRNSDGSWLRCDDLQGSSCFRCLTLEVPAPEVHIVIWENNDFEKTTWNKDIILHGDSSSATCPNAPSIRTEVTSSDVQLPTETSLMSSVQFSTADKPILSTFKEITTPYIDCVKENNIKGTSNSNLCSDLEHPGDDTMITLNLVEVKVDDKGNPLCSTQFIPDAQRLQNSPQVTIDHNISVHPHTEVQYSNEESHQIAETVVNFDVAQKHVLHSEMPSSPFGSLQLQDTGVPDVQLPMLQRDSSVKTLTVTTAPCQVEKMKILSENSEIPTKSDNKIQKEDCNKITASLIVKSPAANKSSADIARPAVTKRSFTGWGKSLLNRHLSILSTNEPRTTTKNEVRNTQRSGLIRVTNSKHPVKEHFDGFKSKNLPKLAQKPTKNLPESPDLTIPNITCIQKSNPQQVSNMKENCKDLLSKKLSLGAHTLNKIHLSNSSKFGKSLMHETGTCNMNYQGSVPVDKTEPNNIDSKAQKLRLKLLKKLQTKKNQLASLDQLMKTNQCGEAVSPEQSLNLANNNGDLVYDDFLNELWRQPGVEDSESVCTSSSASLSSSPNHDELLAELFTPTTATTFDCMKHDLRLCEMPPDGVANGKPNNDYSMASETENNDCTSPISALNMQQQAYRNEFIGITNNHASSFESPIKDEMLVDLLSISTLNSLTEEHELPNFDEDLFENC